MTEHRATTPQHLIALASANHTRLARSALKHEVADGKRTTADVILDPPREAHNMTVSELLRSQRRWGTTRCVKFLAEVGIHEAKTLGTLTPRQRRVLAEALQPAAVAA